MFDQLVCRVVERGLEYTIVRPGISFCLIYSTPAEMIAPAVADILEEYMAFIPQGALQAYLAADGTWKQANKRVFGSTLRKLRSIESGNYAEFHFGQEPLANVGDFGAHFKGGPLADDFFPNESCTLYLEFPLSYSDPGCADRLVEFVKNIALMCRFDSGYCGYAFKHLHMTFCSESYEFIGRLAMRYAGFDICNDVIGLHARGKISNVSWLNLFGEQISRELGGIDEIRKNLVESMVAQSLNEGVFVRAADVPIVGDVNRGAADVKPLQRLAELTKEIRLKVDNIGPREPEFAERWLSRFDEL
ncbi:MAG: DUF3396 domain-containing protein [Kiloniellales bacterium]|nr:DUF3396 domain-containing protein [Kiloniellales bacterium]